MATLPELTISEAEALAKATDYAFFAVEEKGQCECGRKVVNRINFADAGAFFLEGYLHAKRLLQSTNLLLISSLLVVLYL